MVCNVGPCKIKTAEQCDHVLETGAVLLSMIINMRLCRGDLIALQRLGSLPVKSEIGSGCWCGKNVDGQVVMCSVSSLTFLLMHCLS